MTRLGALPKSMLVLGGGYIAAEMSHVFGSLGTRVTIIARGEQLLARHDLDVRARFTHAYAERFDVRLGSRAQRVSATRKGIRLDLATPACPQQAEGQVLLVATGRPPNSDSLSVAAGIEVDAHGHLRTDDTHATNVPGIWALGDLANHCQLKHMANAEARLVRYNLLHPRQPRRAAFTVVPSAVFADPQVASAGVTEQDLQAQGRDCTTGTKPYSDTACGWALEDTSSFVKILADPASRLLLGAHLLGPQAATLIQPLAGHVPGQHRRPGGPGVMYIHPALTEVVEQALLEHEAPPVCRPALSRHRLRGAACRQQAGEAC